MPLDEEQCRSPRCLRPRANDAGFCCFGCASHSRFARPLLHGLDCEAANPDAPELEPDPTRGHEVDSIAAALAAAVKAQVDLELASEFVLPCDLGRITVRIGDVFEDRGPCWWVEVPWRPLNNGRMYQEPTRDKALDRARQIIAEDIEARDASDR